MITGALAECRCERRSLARWTYGMEIVTRYIETRDTTTKIPFSRYDKKGVGGGEGSTPPKKKIL